MPSRGSTSTWRRSSGTSGCHRSPERHPVRRSLSASRYVSCSLGTAGKTTKPHLAGSAPACSVDVSRRDRSRGNGAEADVQSRDRSGEITSQASLRDAGRGQLSSGEYRVISSVSAFAWNGHPDKARIQAFSLLPPPGVPNRFVSYVTPLPVAQTIPIVSS
jgi:hypothetical protein